MDNNELEDFLDEDLFDEPTKKYSPITIAAIVFAFIALAGSAWYIYDSYKETTDDEMLLITADDDNDEIKVAPLDPGGMVVDNMDKSVYEQIEDNKRQETKTEIILLPSEEPIDKSVLIEAQEQEDLIEKAIIATELTISNKAINKPKEVSKLIKEISTPPKAKSTKKIVKKANNKTKKFYKVQIASLQSKSEAETEWNSIKHKFKAKFNGYSRYIVTKEIPGKGTFYRLQVGPFANGVEAHTACKEFKNVGSNCFIIKP